MGPIEHTVCQIAFKIEEKYQDKDFANQVFLLLATLLHSVENPPSDWEEG